MVGLDDEGGLIAVGRGEASRVAFPDYFDDVLRNGEVRYATHNHPRNSGLSQPDLATMLVGSQARRRTGRPDDMAITAMG